MTDLLALGLFATVLLGAVALGEALRVGAGWAPESTRRAVHVLVGLAVAACPPWFDGPGPIYALAVVFLAGNVVAVRRGWMPGMHGIARRSWGTVTFPLALLVALALCWSLDPGRVYVLQTAFAVLALPDPAASWVGTRLTGPGAYRVGAEAKSVAGSAAFFAAAVASGAAVLAVAGPGGLGGAEVAGWALVAGALATLAEALGRRGWDNFWIVLAVVVVLSALDADPDALGRHLVALAVAVAFGVAAYRAQFLDLGGALAASGLAWMVVALGGVAWAVPAVTFFVLSSLLSKAGRGRKAGAEALVEKGSRRDVGQVVANGGVGAALLAASAFWASGGVYAAFVGAFAAAAADTWATEIGTWARGTTRTLLVGTRVAPGTSGGMSMPGTFGAVLGAAVVTGSAVAIASPPGGAGWMVVVVAAGVGGSFVDSLMGATLQARYWMSRGVLTERAETDGRPLPLAAGVRGLDNDGVNWACTLTGAALAALGMLTL